MAKMTLDNLAVIIKREFDRVNEKFDEHDQQFRQINNKLDSMQADILSIKLELHDINVRLDRLEKRTLEDDSSFTSDILDLRKRVKAMERKIVKLLASKK